MPARDREVPRGRRPTPTPTLTVDADTIEWIDISPEVEEGELSSPPFEPRTTPAAPSGIDFARLEQETYETLLRRSGFPSSWSAYTSTGIRLSENNTAVPPASLKERCIVCRNRFDLADLNSHRLCKTCAPNYATCNRCVSTLHVQELYDYTRCTME